MLGRILVVAGGSGNANQHLDVALHTDDEPIRKEKS
jgi:hypothetical protein